MSLYVPSSDTENEMNCEINNPPSPQYIPREQNEVNREGEINYNPPSPQYIPREENEMNGQRGNGRRRQRRNPPRPRPRNRFPRALQDGLGEMNRARGERRRRRGVLDISIRLRLLLNSFRHACK